MRRHSGRVFQVEGDLGVDLIWLLQEGNPAAAKVDVRLASGAFGDDEVMALESTNARLLRLR